MNRLLNKAMDPYDKMCLITFRDHRNHPETENEAGRRGPKTNESWQIPDG